MSSANASLVPAVFRDRTSAEAAVDALQLAAIARDDIGLAVPLRAPNRIREDTGAEALAGAGRGLAVGAPVGILGGIALATLAATGPLGVGGLFLAGASGMLWGGTIGTMVGVQTRVRRQPDVDRWCELGLDEQSVLVVVRVRDWSREPEIAALLKSAGAVSIEDHTELDRSWRELEQAHRSGQSAPVA
jgi:hypothetical protein